MKINPLADAFRLIGLKTAKNSRDRDPASGGYDPQRQHKHQDPEKEGQGQPSPETLEVTDEKVAAAVAAFASDASSKANGLVASVSGHGPGLKVTLKDSRGAVLRHYSGEEFLKLRATAKEDSRTRGRLLDRKY